MKWISVIMMSGNAPETITGIRDNANLSIPDHIYLISPLSVKMLDSIVFTTGKTHNEVLNTAIENLYYKKNDLQDLFNIEVTDAT